MRATVLLVVLLFLAAILNAQQDTTTIKWAKGKILIISDNDSIVKVEMNDSLKKESKKEKRFKGKWAGLEIGVNGFVTSSGTFSLPDQWSYLVLNQPKSINVNFNVADKSISLIKKRAAIVTGIGFSWYNYRFSNQTVLEGNASELSFHYDSLVRKSKLTISYIRVPLLLEFHIPINQGKDKLYFAGGIIGGLRIGNHAKYKYIINGDSKQNKDFSEFHLNPVNYSVQLRMGIDDFGIYMEYQPMSLFKERKGPELYPWSAGISLIF